MPVDVTITIPDAKVQLLKDYAGAKLGVDAATVGVPEGQQILEDLLRADVQQWKREVDEQVARDAYRVARDQAEADAAATDIIAP